NQSHGCLSSGRCLRRPHPERRQARRSAGPAGNQVRACDQLPGCEDDRARGAGDLARARRRGDRVRRRDVIALIGGAAAAPSVWPLAARAQPAMPLVALISTAPREDYARLLSAFAQGLAESAYSEGRNVTFDYRWVSSEPDLPALAAEIVGRGPSVILTIGGTAAALAVKNATPRVPVVFIVGSDPGEFGLVGSLNRPGSNITGLTSLSNSLAAKQLEILHELAPNATTIGLMLNPNNPNSEHDAREARRAVEAIGHKLIIVSANS